MWTASHYRKTQGLPVYYSHILLFHSNQPPVDLHKLPVPEHTAPAQQSEWKHWSHYHLTSNQSSLLYISTNTLTFFTLSPLI